MCAKKTDKFTLLAHPGSESDQGIVQAVAGLHHKHWALPKWQTVTGPPLVIHQEDGRATSEKAAEGRGGLPKQGRMRKTHK